MKKKILLLLSLPSVLFIGIKVYNYFNERHFDYEKNIEALDITVDIFELNKEINSENIGEVFDKHKMLARYYWGDDEKKRDEFIKSFSVMYKNAEFQSLCSDINEEFKNLSLFKKELTYAFKTLKFYFNDFKIPEVYTIVSGFGTNLYIDKDIVIIPLEYFLSDKKKWPSNIPRYLAETCTIDSLATKIILEIVSRMTKFDNSNKSLLNHMLFSGRVIYFTRIALPKVDEEIILEQTKKNFDYLMNNEMVIWNFFLENEYLYSDNYLLIRSFIGKSPFTQEISMKCPGNVGAFIGYRIIKSFMDHNSYEVKDLIEEYDAQYFFDKSKYNPLQK